MIQDKNIQLLNLCLILLLGCLNSCSPTASTSSYETREKFDAQYIVSIYESSKTAGHDFAAGGMTDPETIAFEVAKGHTIKDPASPYNGSFFGIPNLSHIEIQDASLYLDFDTSTNMLTLRSAPKPLPPEKLKEQKKQMTTIAIGMGSLIVIVCLVAAIIRLKQDNADPKEYL